MKLRVKGMPAIMAVLSACYFVYVLLSEDTTLSADAVGGDPGGKALPMAMAVFMFFGFLYLTLRERPDEKGMDPGTKRLFAMTLVLSVLYVLLIRPVGFIVLSAALLYSLEYVFTTIDEERDIKKAAIGGVGTTGTTVLVYFMMRVITRNLMALGRAGTIPGIFAAPTFEALLSLAYVALAVCVFRKTVCKRMGAAGLGRISDAGLLTLAAVLFLYVVFKQFFNVNLAPGILNF